MASSASFCLAFERRDDQVRFVGSLRVPFDESLGRRGRWVRLGKVASCRLAMPRAEFQALRTRVDGRRSDDFVAANVVKLRGDWSRMQRERVGGYSSNDDGDLPDAPDAGTAPHAAAIEPAPHSAEHAGSVGSGTVARSSAVVFGAEDIQFPPDGVWAAALQGP
jgi:hypothetical protein